MTKPDGAVGWSAVRGEVGIHHEMSTSCGCAREYFRRDELQGGHQPLSDFRGSRTHPADRRPVAILRRRAGIIIGTAAQAGVFVSRSNAPAAQHIACRRA